MRSRALNRAFNRALIDLEYRRDLLRNVRAVLSPEGVPIQEISQLERAAPHDIRELAEALEAMHALSFH